MDFDFGVNVTVADLAKVPEQFHGLYGEKEGGDGFTLKSGDSAVGGAVEAVLGLNKALKAERNTNKDLRKGKVDLTALAEYGDGVEEIAVGIRTKMEEYEEKLASGTKAKVDVGKIKADLAKAHARETEQKEQRITALTNQLNSILIDSTAKSSIADADGDVDLVLPFVRQRTVPIEEDGQFSVKVVDEEKHERYSAVTGKPMTIDDLVKEMKSSDKYARLFNSKANSGSGSTPGSVSQTMRAPETANLTSAQKIAKGFRDRATTPR